MSAPRREGGGVTVVTARQLPSVTRTTLPLPQSAPPPFRNGRYVLTDDDRARLTQNDPTRWLIPIPLHAVLEVDLGLFAPGGPPYGDLASRNPTILTGTTFHREADGSQVAVFTANATGRVLVSTPPFSTSYPCETKCGHFPSIPGPWEVYLIVTP